MVSNEVNIEKQTTTTTTKKQGCFNSVNVFQSKATSSTPAVEQVGFISHGSEGEDTYHGEPWGVSGRRCLKDPII